MHNLNKGVHASDLISPFNGLSVRNARGEAWNLKSSECALVLNLTRHGQNSSLAIANLLLCSGKLVTTQWCYIDNFKVIHRRT